MFQPHAGRLSKASARACAYVRGHGKGAAQVTHQSATWQSREQSANGAGHSINVTVFVWISLCLINHSCTCLPGAACRSRSAAHSHAAMQWPHCGNRCPGSGRWPQSARQGQIWEHTRSLQLR